MAQINYIEHNGKSHLIQVEIGSTVMDGAYQNGIEGIVAQCGGAGNCATCHCYIDDAWMAKVGQAKDVEKEMLELVPDLRESSRLSCQIEVDEELDGLIIYLPESQY